MSTSLFEHAPTQHTLVQMYTQHIMRRLACCKEPPDLRSSICLAVDSHKRETCSTGGTHTTVPARRCHGPVPTPEGQKHTHLTACRLNRLTAAAAWPCWRLHKTTPAAAADTSCDPSTRPAYPDTLIPRDPTLTIPNTLRKWQSKHVQFKGRLVTATMKPAVEGGHFVNPKLKGRADQSCSAQPCRKPCFSQAQQAAPNPTQPSPPCVPQMPPKTTSSLWHPSCSTQLPGADPKQPWQCCVACAAHHTPKALHQQHPGLRPTSCYPCLRLIPLHTPANPNNKPHSPSHAVTHASHMPLPLSSPQQTPHRQLTLPKPHKTPDMPLKPCLTKGSLWPSCRC